MSQKRARYHLQTSGTNENFQTVSSCQPELQGMQSYSSDPCFEQQPVHISSDSSLTDWNQESDSYTSSDDSVFSLSSSDASTSDSLMSCPGGKQNDVKDDTSRYTYTTADEARKPIYKGYSHSLLTSYTSVMLFVTKHSLSKEAFSDLLLLIATHLPVSNVYTKSIYKVKEFLKDFIDVKEPELHSLCENCHQILDGKPCTSIHCRRINAKTLEFHDLHLQDQLKDLFKGL